MVRFLVLGASIVLAGCGSGNGDICTAPVTLEKAMAAIGQPYQANVGVTEAAQRSMRYADFATACVHRWSYRLAKSPDSATTVADAVVAGCDVPLRNWSVARSEAFTDYRTNAYEATQAELRNLALFHVVQARAGNCPVPR